MFMPGWFSHAVIFNKEKQEWMEEQYNVVGPAQNWNLQPGRSLYTGLDSHTGSGVRGAAKPDQLGRDVCTLPQT